MNRLTPGKSLIWLLGLGLLFPAFCLGQEEKFAEREWVDNTGNFRIKAEFIEVQDGKVRLRRTDNGKVIAVPLDRLSDKDRQFINDMNKPAEEAVDSESAETPPKDPKPEELPPKDTTPKDPKPEEPKKENSKSEEKRPNETPKGRAEKPGTDSGDTKTDPIQIPPARTENQPLESGGQFDPGGQEKMPAEPDTTEPAVADDVDQAKPLPESNVTKEVTESSVPERQPVQPNQGKMNPPETTENSPDESIPSRIIPFRPKREPEKEKRDSEIPKFEPDEIVPQNPDLIGMPEKEEPETFEAARPEDALPQGEPYGRYLETDIHPVIDATQVEEEIVANRQAWTTMTNEQLVETIQVSGNLTWKGKVNVRPTLQPILPNYELVIGARGAELLDSASNVGFVELETFVDEADNRYEPVARPPNMLNPLTGWVQVRRGAGGKFAQGGIRPVFVNLEFARPRKVPKRINSAKGTFKLRLVTEYRQITVKNVPANRGRIELPSLAESGIEILITRPDPMTIVARIASGPDDVFDVKMTAEDSTLGESSLTIQDTSYHQFNFVSEIPQGLDLKIRLVTRDREVTLPFEFSNLPFTVDM